MKYTVHGFSQKKAIELGLGNDELLILRWLIDFKNTNKMKKMIKDGAEWVWVNYAGILEDLPIIVSNKKTIQRKINKLINCGIIERYIYRKGGSYTYFKILEDGYTSLLTYYPEDKKDQKRCTKKSRRDVQKSPDVKDKKVQTNNPSTNNPFINTIAREKEKENSFTKMREKENSFTKMGERENNYKNILEQKIQLFFTNITKEEIEIIEEIDPSFYKLKNYKPTLKELSIFLENNSPDIFNYFDIYLHSMFQSENIIYNNKLLFPRLALFNSVPFRLNELLKIYYEVKEDTKEEDMKENLVYFKNNLDSSFFKRIISNEKNKKKEEKEENFILSTKELDDLLNSCQA